MKRRITLYIEEHDDQTYLVTSPVFPNMRFPGSSPEIAVNRFWNTWEKAQEFLRQAALDEEVNFQPR